MKQKPKKQEQKKRRDEIMEKRWITNDEAAELLGITPGTLENWRVQQREDQPKCHKIGRNIKYKPSDVEAWIEEHAVKF